MPVDPAEYDAFLRAVLAAPGDDLPRLVLADRLDEWGEGERAEFVRLQCELAGLPAGPLYIDPESAADWAALRRADALRRRERELRRHFGSPGFFDDLPGAYRTVETNGDITTAEGMRYTPRRGFVEAVASRCEDWMRHGPDIVGRQPVTGVRLTGREPADLAIELPAAVGLAGGNWRWYESRSGLPRPDSVPPEIHEHLSGAGVWRHRYPTPETARADLSRAAILWARAEHNRRLAAAGLTPLEFGELPATAFDDIPTRQP